MGYVLLWLEGLALALLTLAILARGAAQGAVIRIAGMVLALLLFFLISAVAVHATAVWQSEWGHFISPDLFVYSLSWLLAYVVSATILIRRAFRRPEPGMGRVASGWSSRHQWLGFVGTLLAFGLTFWNLDLAMRAELAVARQEAGDLLLNMAPAPVPDSENATALYVEAGKNLVAEIPAPWHDAAWKGTAQRNVSDTDWTDKFIVELVAGQEDVLAVVRKASAMPRSTLGPRLTLDAWEHHDRHVEHLRTRELALLAVDARVKAAQGDLVRAFEDIDAILGMTRHVPTLLSGPRLIGTPLLAWRTLEDVLQLAKDSKQPVPELRVTEAVPAFRALHQELAVMAMVWPSAAQDPLRILKLNEDAKPWSDPPLVYGIESLVFPAIRVFLMPDELTSSQRIWDEYRRILSLSADGTPVEWAAIRRSIQSEPTGILSAVWIKPKEKALLKAASEGAALKQLAHTALAAVRYRQKHGQLPDRLEQLVPDFLSAAPVDPRDGQVLQMRQFPDLAVLYTLESNPEIAEVSAWTAAKFQDQPVFRLPR